ncbi:MAG TPA: tripartite tricarboxylate transporter substrate binding protein [Burkholderiaceae bacterium]|jgi:tripartite-type tricarboxylate transporter receptor subunit TctC|nr:tripartite tricarboxylate transporter substrate binding protein [Burkholderiaceae bacterium]
MNPLMRRAGLRGAALLMALLAAVPLSTLAQDFPSRPVRFIVPFPPGGPVDTVARALAQKVSEYWGQPVLVENRAGAGGIVGAEAASRATPDGYTVFVGSIHHSVLPGLGMKLSYDIERDFTPVIFGARFPIILVANPALPASSVKDLIAYAKANPAKLTYSSAGNGGGTHLAGELFKNLAGVFILHIPYRGSSPAMADVIGGQTQMMFADGPTALAAMRGGRVKALAVGSPQRSALVPQVPTMTEAGVKGYEAYSWTGLWVPAGTPGSVVAKLNADMNRAFSDPATKDRLLGQGAEPAPGTAAEFGAFVRAEKDKWARVIKAANIKPD